MGYVCFQPLPSCRARLQRYQKSNRYCSRVGLKTATYVAKSPLLLKPLQQKCCATVEHGYSIIHSPDVGVLRSPRIDPNLISLGSFPSAKGYYALFALTQVNRLYDMIPFTSICCHRQAREIFTLIWVLKLTLL